MFSVKKKDFKNNKINITVYCVLLFLTLFAHKTTISYMFTKVKALLEGVTNETKSFLFQNKNNVSIHESTIKNTIRTK